MSTSHRIRGQKAYVCPEEYASDPGELALARLTAGPLLRDRWQAIGSLYGYRQCCINFFCDEWDPAAAWAAAYKARRAGVEIEDGFLPCLECLAALEAQTVNPPEQEMSNE